MTAFSRTTYLLRVLWEVLPLGLWAYLAIRSALYLGGGIEMFPWLSLLISAVLVAVLLRLLRPLRQRLLLASYERMLRSKVPALVELGVWKLLLAAYGFWPGPFRDYAGLETLERVYPSLDGATQTRLLEIAQRLKTMPSSKLVNEARDFLQAMETPTPTSEPRP